MPRLPEPLPDCAGLLAAPSAERRVKSLSDHKFEHVAA
jgi:hypothetical protein